MAWRAASLELKGRQPSLSPVVQGRWRGIYKTFTRFTEGLKVTIELTRSQSHMAKLTVVWQSGAHARFERLYTGNL
jgi:hypothetical protein